MQLARQQAKRGKPPKTRRDDLHLDGAAAVVAFRGVNRYLERAGRVETGQLFAP